MVSPVRASIEHTTAAERRRDPVLVSNGGIKIGLRPTLRLDCFDEAVQPFESTDFVGVAESGGIQRRLKHRDGFIVGFQRNRKRMTIFAADGKRKARRIGK